MRVKQRNPKVDRSIWREEGHHESIKQMMITKLHAWKRRRKHSSSSGRNGMGGGGGGELG